MRRQRFLLLLVPTLLGVVVLVIVRRHIDRLTQRDTNTLKNCCRKSNTTKYRGFKFRSICKVGTITMLILKVLLLRIIITMSTKLNLTKKFTLDAIIFQTISHSLPYYGYVALIFDSQFGSKQIAREDLVNEGIIIDNLDFKKYPSDVIACLRISLLLMSNWL